MLPEGLVFTGLPGPDIPDSLQKLTEIPASTKLLQALIIHGKAFFHVFFDDSTGPDPELHSPL